MASQGDLDRVVVNELRLGVLEVNAPAGTPKAATLDTRRKKRTRWRLVAGGAGLVAAASVVTAVALVPTPPENIVSATPPASSAPPCQNEWSDLIDVTTVKTYSSAEAAVKARVGDEWEVSVIGVDSGGSTVVEVTDPWGRTGTYQTSAYEGGWFVHSGSGCAP